MIKLTVNPDNPRTIDKKDFEKLKKSVQSFTKMLEVRPIAYDENKVIWGGNQRYVALEMLVNEGLIEPKDEYFKEMVGYTLEEKKEFAIRDNVEFGKHDWDVLMGNETWADAPLDEWGLDPTEWTTKEVIEDEAPEVSEEPAVSKLGEIYQLGKHRVMCGDSTSLTDVEILMNNQRASIAFTSPPYNAGTTPTEVKMGKKSKYANDSDNKTQDDYFEFMQLWTNIANEYSDYNFVNVQMLSGNKLALIDYLYLYRNNLAEIMIWNKLTAQPAMANNVLNSQYEFILVFSEKANRAIGTKQFRGTASNVLDISKQTSNEVKDHNATFPVELPHSIVTTFSNKDEIILDLFLGSGSTLIACEQTNRICYGMELDEKYLDVVRKRWAKYVYPDRWEDEWQTLTPSIDKL